MIAAALRWLLYLPLALLRACIRPFQERALEREALEQLADRNLQSLDALEAVTIARILAQRDGETELAATLHAVLILHARGGLYAASADMRAAATLRLRAEPAGAAEVTN